MYKSIITFPLLSSNASLKKLIKYSSFILKESLSPLYSKSPFEYLSNPSNILLNLIFILFLNSSSLIDFKIWLKNNTPSLNLLWLLYTKLILFGYIIENLSLKSYFKSYVFTN